jgi:uncharacterized protein (TIGR03435 family)
MQNRQTFHRIFLLAVAGIVAVGAVKALRAQAPSADPKPPAFDAASVKLNASGPTSMLWAYRGRRFTAQYATVRELIGTAYGAQEHALTRNQISGGPKWIESERFDIVGTAPGVPDSLRGTFPSPVLAMLRRLLEDRFQLKTHIETKEVPLFALVLARADGTLGPRLRRRTIDCISAASALERKDELFDPTPPERRICGGKAGPGTLIVNGATMNNLAQGLARQVPGVDRVVVDRTGLIGTFDVDLTWNFEGTVEHLGVPLPPPDRDAPNLFTALEEQLGLKLESRKGPVDILVIDHVEKPSED